MKHLHLRTISKAPVIAQSNFEIKLEAMTLIIDRLLLLDRQRHWKATGPGDGEPGTGTGTGDTTL